MYELSDRAIQVRSGAGVSQDGFLTAACATVCILRRADVHLDSIARMELHNYPRTH